MIDRRSLTDSPSLSGTDYVLEGASVRDRFLTAFVLQHNGSLQSTWPHPRLPDASHPSGPGAILPCAQEERFRVHVESAFEPLTVRMIDRWFGEDEDDGDM
jgi:hypothetical protein